MGPLTLLGLVLWFLLALRFQLLKKGPTAFSPSLNPLFCDAGSARKTSIVGHVIHTGSDLANRFVEDSKTNQGSLSYFDGSLLLLLKQADTVLKKYRNGIRLVCAVAPLLGLLGTVSGMIETFSSLTGLQSYAGDSTMAGGISKALISTQMGLLVAIPGLVMGRFLDRKEEVLRHKLLEVGEELNRFKEISLEKIQ